MHFDPKEQLASTEEGRKKLVKALMSNSVSASMHIGVNPDDLPRRYLAPGYLENHLVWFSFKLVVLLLDLYVFSYGVLFCLSYLQIQTVRTYSDLYRLYQAEAFAQGSAAASASTFFRTLRMSSWRKKIKFRHASNHAQCAVCHRLKSGIKTARTLHTHAQRADEYMRHLSGIYADRQVYSQYKLRASNQRDIINLIVDSMDRSKFKLPRWPGGRCPKSMETRKRPDMELTAVLCHGRALFVFLTDEDATTGSDWSLEVLSIALNRLFSMAQRNQEHWPSHLRIWTDNTPKETGTEVVLSFVVGFKFQCSKVSCAIISFPNNG